MSGHSKWHQIRHKKGLEDAKKSKIFSKLSRIITVAAREKGGDLDLNPKLRMAIEKAKSFNVPSETIERAIKKGLGEEEGAKLEEVIIEVFGPGGAPMIIAAITDNKNRTFAELKNILNKNSGKFAGEGSVKWSFDYFGILEFEDKGNFEIIENLAIESEAEDVFKKDNKIFVFVRPEEFDLVKKTFEKNSLIPISTELSFIPKASQIIKIEDKKIKESLEKLIEELDNHDDVQKIFAAYS